jgi:hypothetical protein
MMTPRPHILALAGALALSLLAARDVAAGGDDHLHCFSNSDLTVPNLKATADLLPEQSPPFDVQNCRIRLRSSNVCVPATKLNVRDRDGEPYPTLPIAGPSTRPYVCYGLRCPPESPKGTGSELEVEDQLGRRTIVIKRADFFCQPAVFVE